MSTPLVTRFHGARLQGVRLATSLGALRECGFRDCRHLAAVEPLYVIVYEGMLIAVCERCYRTRLRRGATAEAALELSETEP
ncbi:MAG TPA: hypothetical protein VGG32_11170 [Thermoplasmata archaeon]|jgi:hypothetical protein